MNAQQGHKALTVERLKFLYEYSPKTGLFKRLKRTSCRAGIGVIDCGSTTLAGYRSIGIDGKSYYAHRLAWLYTYEVWPTYMIDHINGEKIDNRIINLRDVPRAVNVQNVKKAQKNNKQTGFLGVVNDLAVNKKNPFSAKIKVNSKSRHLGYFPTPELAHEAYLKAKRELHEGCTI